MRLLGLRGAVSVAIAASIVVASAPIASVAEGDGLWYVDAMGIPASISDGHTGAGVKVAVIDGQINPDVPTLQGADLQIREPSFCETADGDPAPATTAELSSSSPTDHGTNAVSMIVGNGDGYPGQSGLVGVAPEATILYYAVYTTVEGGSLTCPQAGTAYGLPVDKAVAAAMNEAMDAGASIISVSLSIDAGPPMIAALARAFREGVIITGGLSNTTELEFTTGIPAKANGAVSVQAGDSNAGVASTDGVPHVDWYTDVVAPGVAILVQGNLDTGSWEEQTLVTGTSLATPLVAGSLAAAKGTFPDATGNQLIQSLIHNTVGEPNHEPTYDSNDVYGYGVLSLDLLVTVDPTQYPDVNPLIDEFEDSNEFHIPLYEEIFPPDGATETSAPTEPETESSGLPILALIGAGFGLLLLIGIIVLVVILAIRKSRAETRAALQTGR